MLRNVVIIIFTLLLTAGVAYAGDFDILLKDLRVEASADLGGYKARLALDFGVSGKTVSVLLEKERLKPEDAYMVLKVAQVAQKPIDTVLGEFRRAKGQGWGVVAKNLGIKPGSAEFHALKERGGGKGKGSGKGRSKGKGRK